MDLTRKRNVKDLLKTYQTFPLKRMGQNFLVSKSAVKRFVKACNLQPKDIVLEIGPGIGTLTIELAKKSKNVIAVEKDPKMVEILKETLKDVEGVKIIQGDILKLRFLANSEQRTANSKKLFFVHCPLFSDYKVVGNLPFYLTAPVIRKFLESENPPKEMALMIQKEVAQRACAKPPKMSLLAVSVQVYAVPKIESYISKKSFWPSPKVDSAIIRIVPRHSAFSSALLRERFFRIAKAGFSHPRKQLANNLSGKLKIDKEKTKNWLLKNKIQSAQRAETLTVQDWQNLAKNFSSINK